MNVQVASAVEKQSLVMEEINSNVAAIGTSSDIAANDASNTANVSQKLSNQALELKALVGDFKVS